jgi:molybdopterin adenylyltransferase
MSEQAEMLVIGLVSVSDRASAGVYKDEGIPALEAWFERAIAAPAWRTERRLIPDERSAIEAALVELVDQAGCHLVLTTGGTGPAWRDVTPEATLALADKPMPGFGEQMRRISLEFVPTAILSRQVAVVRYRRGAPAGVSPTGSLIINLPGQPKSIKETLEGLKDQEGKQIVPGIFAAVPYCIDLIGGPYIDTREDVIKAFRPKSAIRPKKGAQT